MSLPVNEVVCGDAMDVMRARIPDDSVDLVVTSPPYWGLRDYGTETVRVWGPVPECEHEWSEYQADRVTGGSKRPTQSKFAGQPKGGPEYDTIRTEGFCNKCGAWRGSLGLEPHPQMFIDHLVEVCREIRRVLKPSGTFWLNLGDTYYGSGGKGGQYAKWMRNKGEPKFFKQGSKNRSNWLQPKQKLMIPARVAIALQYDGWILRNDIIWDKPNHMPSSVKDRLTPAYEHVFLFVKNNEAIYWVDRFTGQLKSSKPKQYYVHDETDEKRFDRPKRGIDKDWFNEDGTRKFKYAWQGHDYYFDLDAIRKPHTSDGEYRNKLRAGKEKYTGKGAWSIHEFGSTSVFNMGSSIHPKGKNPGDVWKIDNPIISNSRKELHGPTYRRHQIKIEGGQAIGLHSLGKNPGDLWRIPTKPFPGAHFSTFPPKLIEPIVKAGSPRWICSRCGKPRERISETEYVKSPVHGDGSIMGRRNGGDKLTHYNGLPRVNAIHHTVGWSDCGCNANWNPGVVLDPFGGSGTVGQVARRLGRRFIIIEIKPEYAEMARQRVRGRYKPTPAGVVQLTQFMEAEEG